MPKTNSPNTFIAFIFNGCTNQTLHFSSSAPSPSLLYSDISLIDFNNSVRLISAGAHHCFAQFGKPLPGGVITTKRKNTLKPKGISSIFLISNVPHSHTLMKSKHYRLKPIA